MPTASQELRDFIVGHFGSLDCGEVEQELERRGFNLTRDFCWQRGRGPDNFEKKLINFLVEEWDYGGYYED